MEVDSYFYTVVIAKIVVNFYSEGSDQKGFPQKSTIDQFCSYLSFLCFIQTLCIDVGLYCCCCCLILFNSFEHNLDLYELRQIAAKTNNGRDSLQVSARQTAADN